MSRSKENALGDMTEQTRSGGGSTCYQCLIRHLWKKIYIYKVGHWADKKAAM